MNNESYLTVEWAVLLGDTLCQQKSQKLSHYKAQSDGTICERSSSIHFITEPEVVIGPLNREPSLKLFRLPFILQKATVLECLYQGNLEGGAGKKGPLKRDIFQHNI